jgi:ABC-type dipeptide/oligopeptide/nickel transport system permease component
MARFVGRRILGMLLTLLVVATLTFLLSFVVPSDPARTVVGPRASDAQVAQARTELGLDDPIPVQYARYLGHLVRLDFGDSYIYKRPVSELIREKLPWTALLAAAAIVLEFGLGILLGLVLAARPRGLLDRAALGWTVLQVSLPTFWVGLMLLYLFAFKNPLFPLGGSSLPDGLVLPALALGLPGAAVCSRIMRDVALDTLHADFVRALRAKGTPRRTILFKHVLRTSLSPVLTIAAMDFGFLIAGAVLVESVFAWPGLGFASYDAMGTGDIPLLMACVLVFSLIVLVLNLLTDIARAKLDPRVRLG